MMSRVPRLHAAGRALLSSLAQRQRGPRPAPLTRPGRACVRRAFVLAFALVLSGPVFAQDAAQPDKSGEEPQHAVVRHGGGYRVMVRYPKPIMRNGRLVLWHGAWRTGARSEAHPRPGRTAAAPPQAAAPAVAPAKPEAPRALSILADSGDATALRLAGELAGVMSGDEGQVKAAAGAVSRAALAKAISAETADFALVPLDALADPVLAADLRQRAPYVARLPSEEIELVAARSIADIRQLAGRRVNVGAADGAAAASAGLIFSRLNIAANWTNYPLNEALQRLKDGRVDAVLVIGGKNSDALKAFGDDGRFHLVAIPYAPSLSAYYAPGRASAQDWPKLVAPGEKIDTLSAPVALLAIGAAASDRAQPVAAAADRFLANFDQLLDKSKDASWREVNLAARIEQAPRFAPAQAWLDQNAGAANADYETFRALAQAADAANGGPSSADSDRLYQSLIRLSGAGQ